MRRSTIKKVHLQIKIQGFVQGVGFRPFVARLAKQYFQHGWVANRSYGVTIDIEGCAKQQALFLNSLSTNLPPFAEINKQSIFKRPLAGKRDFQIKPSLGNGKKSTFVLPDIAVCQDCIKDIFDPDSRYHHYPFCSCSDCGPRYSIMYSQPYDRARTVMNTFKLCKACEREYRTMDNRRFHAQTIACPDCGPQLRFLDVAGKVSAIKQAALPAAIDQLRAGSIVALKGIGGFQLIVDASNQAAVERLRRRKQRPQKSFALMVKDLASAEKLCFINDLEKAALLSPAAPIVLLKRRERPADSLINKAISPDNNLHGIMLPCSPLHHLLLHQIGVPLVATSGNRQNEPICIDDQQAFTRLSGIADYFLTHDRSILRPLDDSIVRYINGTMTVLRRARGYTPLPITIKKTLTTSIAMGGQLKNTVAISNNKHIILSQHLGDLDSEAAQQQFQATLADLQAFYQIKPTHTLHDLHKGYVSSQFAESQDGNKLPVQHHYAHALSCMAEHGLEPPTLGIVWDGSGLGTDNTLWGGEFLLITRQGFQRFAHFRPFSLPGGAKAIQEPRRAALGLLHEIIADQVFEWPDLAFTGEELELLQAAMNKRVNCPRTTSAGRLFDAIASLLGLCQYNQYEGQAAMLLENGAALMPTDQHYQFQLSHGTPIVIDWQITIEQILNDLPLTPPESIACKFHNTLAEIILAVAKKARQETIVLSGGCFQNAVLTEKAAGKLTSAGFNVYCHEKIPPNDGGLALGQLYAAKFIE